VQQKEKANAKSDKNKNIDYKAKGQIAAAGKIQGQIDSAMG